MSAKKNQFKQVLLIWLIVIAISSLANAFGSALGEWGALVTPIVLLYTPLLIYQKRRLPLDFIDKSWLQVKQSLIYFSLASLVIFPVFLLGAHLYQSFLGYSYQSASMNGLLNLILGQIIMVALPEEVFFRGYMQKELKTIFKKDYQIGLLSVNKGVLLTSFLFAISHSLITVQWWHLFIFFPSMIFAFLKEKTGTILAPILFHASSNILMQWIAVHYK